MLIGPVIFLLLAAVVVMMMMMFDPLLVLLREHGQGEPAAPGRIAADLVLVQCGQAFSGLGELLRPPP
jgi:hypothetical protein